MKIRDTKLFKGVVVALISPLTQHREIDLRGLEKQLHYMLDRGVDGIFVNGTTGEGAYLTIEEKTTMLKKIKAMSRDATLFAACIQPSTQMTLKEIDAVSPLGPDFIVVTTPYYNHVSQGALVEHFVALSKHSKIPIVAYDIPGCTINKIDLETLQAVRERVAIYGMKDSSGDFIGFQEGVLREKEDFFWLQGDDRLDGPSLVVGADGIVTGLGNVWIDPYVEMYKAMQSGKISRVNECQARILKLYEILRVVDNKGILAIKYATSLLGRCKKWTKMYPTHLDAQEMKKIERVLSELHLL